MKFVYNIGDYRVTVSETKNPRRIKDFDVWVMTLTQPKKKKQIIRKYSETSGEAFRQALEWLNLEHMPFIPTTKGKR